MCKASLRFHRRRTPQHLHTFGPKFTAPRPLHRRSHDWNTNWCQRPWYLTSRLWLRPDDHEMHSEQSNFDACWKSVKFYALISDLHLKHSSKRSFPSTNQNRCKFIEDHMMPKSFDMRNYMLWRNYIITDWHETLIWYQHNIIIAQNDVSSCMGAWIWIWLLAWHQALGMVNAILCWIKNSYLSQQRQKTFPTTSRESTSFQVPRPGDLRSNPWTLHRGSPSLQQNTTSLQPPGLHPSFTDSTFLQVQTLDGCVRAEDGRHCLPKTWRSSNQSENILDWWIAETTSIHSVFEKCDRVNVSQCPAGPSHQRSTHLK